MTETQIHMNLVTALKEKIVHQFLCGDPGLLLIDTPGQSTGKKPPQINGYVPDVFVPRLGNNTHYIIGEAKTANDLETRHSTMQITAFLKHCNEVNNSIFFLAVPWDKALSAKSFLKQIVRTNNLLNAKTYVLEKLRG